MNTATALARITELGLQYGPQNPKYQELVLNILRTVWQAGYEFGKEQQ